MDRYIKLKNLEDYIDVHMNYRKAEEELYKPDIYKGIRIAYGDVFKAIESTPTADVVEVIRCKDCEYGEIDDPDLPSQYLCRYDGGSWNDENHYCCYGKRVE